MNGQAKVELMLSLKNRISMGLNQAKKETIKGVDAMQNKMNSLKFGFVKNSKAIADEVPLIGNAFRLASNPIALTAAGVLAIGKSIDYTTQKAADFNTQFRTLSNLNLDKTRKDITDLKNMVLDSAFDKGFDTKKTIMGYFDVQSTTGKYGGEVKRIVEKQGEFANLMQADFSDYIAGTAKGMANFGFGIDKLDEFNRSAYATVKVGVTTFDQLAKVQSVYAGAAASNNQTFDTANKLLALFTIKTKSVDEAATLTKSMFNDLTKDATIKAFKNVGISIYDANGQIKQADNLMLELNKKFIGLDGDKKVIALKNQFTGSEGLIAMIQAATDKSGQLQGTLNSFDSTKLGLNKALEQARNDVNYINERLKNKISVMEIKTGEELLPLKQLWGETKLAIASKLSWISHDILKGSSNKELQYKKGWSKQNEDYGNAMDDVGTLTKVQYETKLNDLFIAMNIAKKACFEEAKRLKEDSSVWKTIWNFGMDADERHGYISSYLSGKYDFAKELYFKFQKEWKEKTNSGLNPLSPLDPAKRETGTGTNTSTNGEVTNQNSLSSSIDTVAGSAKQIRNLNVNIDAFNKGGINTSNTTLRHMEPAQIEEWFTNMCMRIVRSIEATY